MRYITHDHRHAENLFKTDISFIPLYNEVVEVITSISDKDLIHNYQMNERENKKSLSETINKLIQEKLVARGWKAESAIFSDPSYANGKDKKDGVSILLKKK